MTLDYCLPNLGTLDKYLKLRVLHNSLHKDEVCRIWRQILLNSRKRNMEAEMTTTEMEEKLFSKTKGIAG